MKTYVYNQSLIVAGSYRTAQITLGTEFWNVDFGLIFAIKVRRTMKGLHNHRDVALAAAEAFENLKPKQRAEVAAYIMKNNPSTEEKLWCQGAARRTDRRAAV
jgi:hypothetical protein